MNRLLQATCFALWIISPLLAAETRLDASPLTFAGSRAIATTARAGFANVSFQAEVTVTLKGGADGNGCAFFGLGSGEPDPASFNEPTKSPSLSFRLAPSDFGGGQVVASIDGVAAGDAAELGNGDHRLRLSWDAAKRRAWLEIHPNWKSGATFTAARLIFLDKVAAPFGRDAKLFAGGGGGVMFSDFTTRPLADVEVSRLPVTDTFPNDSSARTWLQAVGSMPVDPATQEVDDFLKDLNVHLRPIACWYSAASLQASRTLTGGKLELPGSSWKSEVAVSAVEGQPDARDLTLSFTMEKGGSLSSGVAAAFDFSSWSTDNYVLVPGAIYDGNRLRTVGRGYGAGLDPADYDRKDLPLTQTNVPRLEIEAGKPSKFEVNSSNVTTPAVCVLDRKAKRGFIVLAEQGGRTGGGDFLRKPDGEILDSAFALEESLDRNRATVVVSAPGVRERKPEFIGFSNSPDRGIPLKSGDTIRLRMRVISFAATDVPDLLERFMTVRKGLTGANHPRKLMPASQVETWMTQRIDSRYLTKGETAFYCPENGPWIAFGWIGGWMNTFPMLALGDAGHLERVTKTFEFGLKAQQPSGYFSYAISDDGDTSFRDPAPGMNLSRTSGDTLFWMMKQFLLLKAQGRGNAIKPEWETAMKKLADGMVATWKKHGEWGKLIHTQSGDVGEFNTTGGAMIIGGLALASGYFEKQEYLDVAREAADFYYMRDFVTRGFTTGACSDILQNAESETAAGLMTALMAVHEVSGELRWLEMSRNVANLVATWTVSHDYELPKTTELGGLGAKLAGVYWASTQNKHGAPGICTSSGDPLFKIYRATGDGRYADLLHDIVRAHGESIRPGGFTNERLTFCDAEQRGWRGDAVTGWNETNGILMAQELPGVYLRTDIDRCFTFDAISAKVVSREARGVVLELANPTAHDARVSILGENAAQAAKPLGYTALIQWPKVEVKAGASKRIAVTMEGKLNGG